MLYRVRETGIVGERGTIRSCYSCRVRQEKRELLRFVKSKPDGRWRVDQAALLPGRGLFCHPDGRCLRSPKLEKALGGEIRGAKSGGVRAEALLREALESARVGHDEKLGRNAFQLRQDKNLRGTAAVRELFRAAFPGERSTTERSPQEGGGGSKRGSPSAGRKIRL